MALNNNDLFLINDSQDSNAAKKIKYSTLQAQIVGAVPAPPGTPNLQAVTDVGASTNKTITANAFSGDGSALTNLNYQPAFDADATNLQAAKDYADAGDTATLSSANSAADSKDVTTLNSAKSYTDTTVASAISTSEAKFVEKLVAPSQVM